MWFPIGTICFLPPRFEIGIIHRIRDHLRFVNLRRICAIMDRGSMLSQQFAAVLDEHQVSAAAEIFQKILFIDGLLHDGDMDALLLPVDPRPDPIQISLEVPVSHRSPRLAAKSQKDTSSSLAVLAWALRLSLEGLAGAASG
jgi:hypothetical protein